MQIKALSPNNIIGRHLTTQNRVMPPQKPKKDKGHHNMRMRVTHEAKDNQAITVLPENSKACTTRAFVY
jgi:hypothetical protein